MFWPAACSLVLAMLIWAASLWCLSYRRFNPELSIAVDRGEVWATTGGTYFSPGVNSLRPLDSPFPLSRLNWWPYDGVFWRRSASMGRSLRFPLWMPAALFALPAALTAGPWLRSRTHRRRLRRGLCPTCAYDLSAQPTPDTPCPECGVRASPPTQPSA